MRRARVLGLNPAGQDASVIAAIVLYEPLAVSCVSSTMHGSRTAWQKSSGEIRLATTACLQEDIIALKYYSCFFTILHCREKRLRSQHDA